MIARPYAIVFAALVAAMLAIATVIALHVSATARPANVLLDIALLFFIPGTVTVVALMWLLVAWVIPPRTNAPVATGTLAVTYLSMPVLTFYVCVAAVLRLPLPALNLFFVPLGVMMVVAGNVAGKLPLNHMLGFRTMWALDDADVWDKTQRFGGWVMVIAGLVVINAALLLDLAAVNWMTLATAIGGSTTIQLASRHFARQKRLARDAAWRELAG